MDNETRDALLDTLGWQVQFKERVDHDWIRRINAAVAVVHRHAPGETVLLLRGNPRATSRIMLTMSECPILEPEGVALHLKDDKSLDDHVVYVETRDADRFDVQRAVHDAPGLLDGQVDVYAQLLRDGVERMQAIEMAKVVR